MKIAALSLVNYCQHEKLDVTFSPCLTAVTGAVGSGKSTLLSAINGCISGDFVFSGAKSTFVRNTAPSKAKASAALTVALADGQEAEIIRLLPSGQKLKYAGRTITREAEVEAQLADWLGMPPKAFAELCFAHQGQMSSIISGANADRARSLSRLFKLDAAERSWTAIGDRLAKTTVPALPFDEEALQQRLMNDSQKLAELLDARSMMPEANPDYLDELRKDLANLDRCDQLLATRERLAKDLKQHEPHLAAAQSTVMQIAEDLAGLRPLYDQSQVDEAKEGLRVWKAIDTAKVALAAADKSHKALVGTCKSRPLPDTPPFTPEMQKRRIECAAELRQLSEFLKDFDLRTGIVACPKCRTPTSQFADRISEYQQDHAATKNELQNLERLEKAWAAFQASKTEYERWLSGYQARTEALENQIAALTKSMPPTPAKSSDEYRSFLEQAEATRKLIVQLEGEHRQAEIELARAVAKQQELGRAMDANDASLAAVPAVAGDREALQASLQAHDELERTRARLDAQIDVLQISVENSEASLDSLAAARSRIAKVQGWRQSLETVRDVLHRDALPRDVSQYYLEQLEACLNERLDELGVDYRIRVGDGLTFIARFPDGREVPADRLSGGEKMVASIAWRLTVSATFASDVGILCLDEPTTGLDNDRLDCLRRALERLRYLSGSSGLQCIIVTHAQSLRSLFDHVIDLSSPK